MNAPSLESLRAELQEGPVPGTHEPSVVQFGCEGCQNAHRFVAGWLSSTRLIDMMDSESDLPRAFVIGNLAGVGKASPCEIDSEADEFECPRGESLRTVISRVNPFPEI